MEVPPGDLQDMKRTKKFTALLALATSVFMFGGTISQSSADSALRVNNDLLTAYASCGNKKPFKAAKRCNYDGSTKFRGTFVFKSKVGPLDIKTCFRIYGAEPLGGRHDCAEIPSVTARALPFKTTGVRQSYTVKFTLYVRGAGTTDKYGKAATSSLKVRS